MNNINHPKHYNEGKFECIDVIEDWKLNFNLGNVVKYINRAEHKGNREEDLNKALWYLERELGVKDNVVNIGTPVCTKEEHDKFIVELSKANSLILNDETTITMIEKEEIRPTVQEESISFKNIYQKLEEEIEEFQNSKDNSDNEAEELLDIIQCCYNLLDNRGRDIQEEIKKHNNKLRIRGFKFK